MLFRSQEYTCCNEECRQSMIPRLRGYRRRPHFAHKAGTHGCSRLRTIHDAFVQAIAAHLRESAMTFTLDCGTSRHTDTLKMSSTRMEVNLIDPARRPDILIFGGDGEEQAAIEIILTNYPEEGKIRDLAMWGRAVYFVVVREDGEDPIAAFLSSPAMTGVLRKDGFCTTDPNLAARGHKAGISQCSRVCRTQRADLLRATVMGLLADTCVSHGL